MQPHHRPSPPSNLIGTALALALAACSAGVGSPIEDEQELVDQPGTEGGGEGFAPGGEENPGGEGECASVVAHADQTLQPSDIVVAIDQSGSMGLETSWVKNQLNGFAQQITSSGIDVRVVMIAGKPGSENGFCIPAPLGSGGCPNDDNLPTLLHVDQHVDSHDALERILQRYPEYQPVLRPGASKHIVVISDDDSDMSALEFDTIVRLNDPSFADYRFHSIVAFSDCSHAADEGDTYLQLSALRGGVAGDLCLQNFQPIWDELSTQVIAGSTLACDWLIPEPPDGQIYDSSQVNVELSIDGAPLSPGNVPTATDCSTVGDGWYYDDPSAPSRIHACPDTCARIQAATTADVSISFGCQTVSALPE
ncbi:MAG: VWA domain-containing protein [Deltaproteobacteria bacterium]|jgi:hypothetical protein|nr:VWA domain-containing protein [Deltaproteobacteria bacterium]MBW2532832.1 VWA domain-containing protein [Deltaproteobacteria bacterium]